MILLEGMDCLPMSANSRVIKSLLRILGDNMLPLVKGLANDTIDRIVWLLKRLRMKSKSMGAVFLPTRPLSESL